MPFVLAVADEGRTGRALRVHRGQHLLHGRQQCRRIAKLLPALVEDTGSFALVPHRLGIWLGAACAGLAEDARDAAVYAQMIGHERLGAALDACLPAVQDDAPRSPSVLRALLRREGIRRRAEELDDTLVRLPDLYEVATAFPTGDGIDDVFDWIEFISYGALLDAEGSLTLIGDIEIQLTRFVDTSALRKKVRY